MKNATHFIEVYKVGNKAICSNSESHMGISVFDDILSHTSDRQFLRTVAIFYIKEANTSLKERMQDRGYTLWDMLPAIQKLIS